MDTVPKILILTKSKCLYKFCIKSNCLSFLQRKKIWRLEGGIEPLRVSPPTGLKPAHRTTEAHLGNENIIFALYKANLARARKKYLFMVPRRSNVSLLI